MLTTSKTRQPNDMIPLTNISSKFKHKFLNLRYGDPIPSTIEIEEAIMQSVDTQDLHSELFTESKNTSKKVA